MAKQAGRKRDHQPLETSRLLAVRRVEDGERPGEVLRSLGLCRTSIDPWPRQHRKQGTGKDPRQFGFDFGLRTRQIVAELLREQMGGSLQLAAVGRLLAGLGITPQKPLVRSLFMAQRVVSAKDGAVIPPTALHMSAARPPVHCRMVASGLGGHLWLAGSSGSCRRKAPTAPPFLVGAGLVPPPTEHAPPPVGSRRRSRRALAHAPHFSLRAGAEPRQLRRMPRLRRLASAALALGTLAAAHAADGPALFAEHCASCHGEDGRARTPQGRKVRASDLTLSRLPDAALDRQIRRGSVPVKGRKPAMPAFGDQLDDDALRALLEHVKKFRS